MTYLEHRRRGPEFCASGLPLAERGARWRCRQCGAERAADWRRRRRTVAQAVLSSRGQERPAARSRTDAIYCSKTDLLEFSWPLGSRGPGLGALSCDLGLLPSAAEVVGKDPLPQFRMPVARDRFVDGELCFRRRPWSKRHDFVTTHEGTTRRTGARNWRCLEFCRLVHLMDAVGRHTLPENRLKSPRCLQRGA
jgi:hypothetical protein